MPFLALMYTNQRHEFLTTDHNTTAACSKSLATPGDKCCGSSRIMLCFRTCCSRPLKRAVAFSHRAPSDPLELQVKCKSAQKHLLLYESLRYPLLRAGEHSDASAAEKSTTQELPHKMHLASQAPSFLIQTSRFVCVCAMRPSVSAHRAKAVRAGTLFSQASNARHGAHPRL